MAQLPDTADEHLTNGFGSRATTTPSDHARCRSLPLPRRPISPGRRIHAPDENLRVDDYVKHAKHVARLLAAFAAS